MNRLGQDGGFGSDMRMGRRRHLLVVGAFALQVGLLAGPAQAQEAEPAADGDAIVVSGYRYLSEDTSGTTGLPLSLEKVPQSITLISELSSSTGSCCHSNQPRNRTPLRVSGWEKSRLGRRQRTAARPLRVGVVCARASGPAKSGTSGGKSSMTKSA